MARFFVGQRVRLVQPTHPQNYGNTGRLVRFEDNPKGTECIEGLSTIDADCIVVYDHDPGEALDHTSRLEPILPEGHQPAELSVEELLPFLREGVSA